MARLYGVCKEKGYAVAKLDQSMTKASPWIVGDISHRRESWLGHGNASESGGVRPATEIRWSHAAAGAEPWLVGSISCLYIVRSSHA